MEEYRPDHPIAPRTGWVRLHRLKAYRDRGGVACCDVGGLTLPWRNSTVTTAGEMLCRYHAQTYHWGTMLEAAGRLDMPTANLLNELMLKPCWHQSEEAPAGEG